MSTPPLTIEPYGVAAQLLGGDGRRRAGGHLSISNLDDGFCPSGHSDVVCTLHLAVFGFSNTSYTIVRPAEQELALRLASGVPQQSTLQGNEWRFFSFSLANTSTLGFVVSVTAEYGDQHLRDAGERRYRRHQ